MELVKKVEINDEEINSYPEDTLEQLKERIAVHFDTLPRFLSEIKNDRVHLLEKMVDETNKSTFKKFLKTAIDYFTVRSIAEVWLLKDKENEEQKFLNYQEMKEEVKDQLDIDEYIKNIKKHKKEIEQEKRILKEKIKEKDKIYTKIIEREEQPYIPFIKKGYSLLLQTTIVNRSLDFIFNEMECTDNVPYFCYKNLCKIKKTFSIDKAKKWNETYDDRILLKIKSESGFVDGFFILKDENLQFIIDSTIGTIDSIKSIVSEVVEEITFTEQSETNIRGLIIFPKQYIIKFIMSDLIMNNKNISFFLSVDEKDKATTKKTGLLLKYKGGGINRDSSCNMICKEINRNDIDTKELFKYDKEKTTKEGEKFVRISISNFKDIATVNRFIYLFSKILTIYKEEEKPIISEYKKFIPDIKSFITLDNVIVEKKETLQQKAPLVFSSNCTRRCGKQRLPVILSTDEIEQLDKSDEYKKYITYPKENHFDTITFDNEDIEREYKTQYNYYCGGNSEFPYIGLVERKDNDEDDENYHHYIPCCYKTESKAKTNLDEYFFGKGDKNSKLNQLVIKTIHRLLNPSLSYTKKNLGFIPLNLRFFFQTFYVGDTECEFLRMSAIEKSNSSFHSFLSCVQTATKKNITIKEFYIALQENYDIDLDEMEKLFRDENIYMDPRRWIRLLEFYYQCNIVVFSYHNNNNHFATYVQPRYKGAYLQYEPLYENTIYILENHEYNKVRCELLIMKKDNKFTYMFNHKVNKFITQFYLEPSKKKLIKYSKIPPSNFVYKFQIVDSYNKTRGFITESDIVLLCDPIPPINLPLKSIDTIDIENNIKNKELRGFLKKLHLDEPHIKNILEFKYGMFTIKIKDEKVDLLKDTINEYINIKKISHILGEYFIYRFSCFCFEKTYTEYTIENIKEFIDNFVKVTSDVSYKILPSSLIKEKRMKTYGYINDEKKIIIENNETLKRLICLLRLCISNNIKKVETYCTKKEFDYFYESITDFKKSETSYLFYLSDIVNIQIINPIVYSTFQPFSYYYLRFENKLFFVEEIKDMNIVKTKIEKCGSFIEYDTHFKIVNKSSKITENIFRYITISDKEVQQLILI